MHKSRAFSTCDRQLISWRSAGEKSERSFSDILNNIYQPINQIVENQEGEY